ncbi:MAG: hypothetical protein JWL96_2173 [Sphingomonas bacterium]|uniref:DUF6445 family protein n=1 Tax=Sphingomonas bacterium TaxID=1895847 RepID=UPI002621275A|nr:DUF6445 family protein [Sphingomonas bacterium]MDB5710103.1 hypothetical protein [Sphingomonas bacterium]
MTPELRRVGVGKSPVVVVDDVSKRLPAIVDLAAAMAPFPRIAGNYYPGLRRIIHEWDETAFAYARETLRIAAPFIGGAFDVDGFDLIEASFSMITVPPATLLPAQRAPHFDSTDPDYIAVLHYLSDMPGTGTAFYRQRATGIEVVDEANVSRFVATAKREAAARPATYINGTDAHFEQIAAVQGVPDRLIIYRGNLLHSGIIPPGMSMSDNPRSGRLTANLFVKGRRG